MCVSMWCMCTHVLLKYNLEEVQKHSTSHYDKIICVVCGAVVIYKITSQVKYHYSVDAGINISVPE